MTGGIWYNESTKGERHDKGFVSPLRIGRCFERVAPAIFKNNKEEVSNG